MIRVIFALLLAAAPLATPSAMAQSQSMTQPSPTQNQSQMQANQAQQPRTVKTNKPTSAAQTKPDQHPELAR